MDSVVGPVLGIVIATMSVFIAAMMTGTYVLAIGAMLFAVLVLAFFLLGKTDFEHHGRYRHARR